MLYAVVFVFILLNIFISKHTVGDKRKKEKWFMLSTLLVLGVMSACRFQTGATSDMYRNYIHTYEAEFRSWSEVLKPSLESLHWVLRKIVITIFRDPQAYFFVTAFFISGVTIFAIKKYTPDIYLGLLLYYTGSYFSANNITGQYIAIAIAIISIKYIIEEKPVKFAVCVMLALGFHASAFVIIPLYFLSKHKFSRTTLAAYAVFAVLLVIFNRQVSRLIQVTMYSNYANGSGYGEATSNPLRLVWPAFGIVCLLIMKLENYKCVPKSYENSDRQIKIFNNLLCHGAVLAMLCSLLSAVNMLMFSRLGSYFSIYSSMNLLYGTKASVYNKNRKLLTIALWTLVIVWFAVMDYSGKLNPTPYTPFWEYPWRAKP